MMRAHVVRQGEFLAGLAHRMGFDADEVWNHDKNKELREKRPNPNLLAPGDVLYVPINPARMALRVSPGITNQFKAKIPTVTVSIILRDGADVMRDEPYAIEGLGEVVEGATDANGRAEFEAPIDVREVRIVLPKRQRAHPVRIGDLDPVEEHSGVRQRLEHLGFYGITLGSATSLPPPVRDDRDAFAIKAFQRVNGLPETGLVDDATREALLKSHGG